MPQQHRRSALPRRNAAGDEDEDVLPVARPREIAPMTVDLISSRERERELSVIVCLGVSNSRVFFSVYLFSFCENKTLACSRKWLRMREAEAAAPPPKCLRLSIKRHRSSLPPPIPKDPVDIPATSAIDHLSGGSSRRKFLAASLQHGPSPSPSIARGEPIDNAGDVCRTVDKSIAASPLSSDGFAVGSLAAEEICLLRRCSSSALDFGPSEVVAAGTVPSSGNIPILLLFD